MTRRFLVTSLMICWKAKNTSLLYFCQMMCRNLLTVTLRLQVILGGRVFSESWSTFTRVRSYSVVTNMVRTACIWWLALIDICRNHEQRRKLKCLALKVVKKATHSIKNWRCFPNRGVCYYVDVLCIYSQTETALISGLLGWIMMMIIMITITIAITITIMIMIMHSSTSAEITNNGGN